ncbi:hypothetical protein [Nannocystis radixulma]|uniref:Uncharacterized protein n=1 Tax=Nannocystis radixulma TaxID=2995305 RepID=A0ABT5BI20_9BACT|nr:hypothetical protein [Nannocystis radixulma]MDC0671510.1 hypothetical protein [Nannocystis radixulma]MDC0673805.1 hypothetical protein [Nannocystis radixulma]
MNDVSTASACACAERLLASGSMPTGTSTATGAAGFTTSASVVWLISRG